MKDQRKSRIRLFFALWPDEPARRALLDARDTVFGVANQLGPRPARATHHDDLHVTLVFIGDVDPALVSCVESAAGDVNAAPFDLRFTRIATWRRQRLLAAEPDEPPDALFDLVGQLQQNLLACGITPESRRYCPHVTLVRRAELADASALDVRWSVQDFVLARSGGRWRGADGGGYRVLRRWLL